MFSNHCLNSLSQLPGNLVLRKFGVRNWMTFIVTAWGIVQLAMGFVPTWGYLTLMRILLGALEVRLSNHMA
jgi:MFS family permease